MYDNWTAVLEPARVVSVHLHHVSASLWCLTCAAELLDALAVSSPASTYASMKKASEVRVSKHCICETRANIVEKASSSTRILLCMRTCVRVRYWYYLVFGKCDPTMEDA